VGWVGGRWAWQGRLAVCSPGPGPACGPGIFRSLWTPRSVDAGELGCRPRSRCAVTVRGHGVACRLGLAERSGTLQSVDAGERAAARVQVAVAVLGRDDEWRTVRSNRAVTRRATPCSHAHHTVLAHATPCGRAPHRGPGCAVRAMRSGHGESNRRRTPRHGARPRPRAESERAVAVCSGVVTVGACGQPGRAREGDRSRVACVHRLQCSQEGHDRTRIVILFCRGLPVDIGPRVGMEGGARGSRGPCDGSELMSSLLCRRQDPPLS
jgi:hypothetical protein